MNAKISERVRADVGLATADIQTAKTGPWYPVANARRIRAVVVTGAPATGKKVTLELLQATSSAGAGSKALTSVDSPVSIAAQPSIVAQVEAQVVDLDVAGGYGFVAVRATSDNAAALNAAAVIEFADERYA